MMMQGTTAVSREMNPFADFHRTEMTDQQIIDQAYAKKYKNLETQQMSFVFCFIVICSYCLIKLSDLCEKMCEGDQEDIENTSMMETPLITSVYQENWEPLADPSPPDIQFI